VLDEAARFESFHVLSRFRTDLYGFLTTWADTLFELSDALFCADGPVRTLVGLSLVPEHRRDHGGLHDAVNSSGRVDVTRLRRSLAGLPLPRAGRAGRGAIRRCLLGVRRRKPYREFTYVDDVVDATVAAARASALATVINVGGGTGISLRHILDLAN